MIRMYDAVTVGNIPADAQALALYADGRYADVASGHARFPNLPILSITVRGGDADACDCETGDLTVDEAVAWVERQLAAGRWRPCVYANENTWVNLGLANRLAPYGNRIRRWMAKYDDVPEIPAGYDAKQYHGGITDPYDISVVADDFFHPAAPVDPHHYDRFPTGPFRSPYGKLNERALVEEWDAHKDRRRALKPKLVYLRKRVWWVAHNPLKHGKPTWGQYHRGWRWQELARRTK